MRHTLRLLPGLLTLSLLSTAARAQGPATLFINDLSTAGDVYTTAPGNDATGNGSTAAPYATVARALESAGAATATVFVDAGTYSEQVVLSRNVSLQGAGTVTASPASATIFDGGLAPSSSQSFVSGIFITASGGTAGAPVTIADMTIRNYDLGIQTDISSSKNYFLLEDVETVNNRQFGIYWNGQGGAQPGTSNIIFRRVRASGSAAAPNTSNNGAGRGLYMVNGNKQHILIEDSFFENNRRAGIDINDGSIGDLTIRGCRFGGNLGAAMSILGIGGVRDGGGTYTSIAALLENNAIINNFSNGFELKSCTGTGKASGPGSLVVRNNRIVRQIITNSPDPSFDNAGIAFVDRDRASAGAPSVGGVNGDLVTGGAWIEGNTIRGYYSTPNSSAFNVNAFGMVLEGSNNKVVYNQVSQCQFGIQVQDRPTGSSSQINPYFGGTGNVLLVSAGDSIRQNRIDSCQVTGIRAINLTNVVDAALNWLDGTSAAEIRGATGFGGRVRTLNGSFTEVSSLTPTGRIDYNPFLNSRTDVSAAAGWQGDLSFLNVNQDSPAAGSTGRLGEGASLVLDGGTVEALAGVYSENAVVTKSFTLTQEGAGSLTLTDLTLNGVGKTLTLGVPLLLSNSLTLTNGFVATTATNLLTMPDNATSTEGNAGSYVAGPLRKLGNDAFVFPLGRDGVWARLAISAPADAASSYTGEYFAQPYSSGTLSPPLVRVSRVEYWTLTHDAGSGLVAVRLYWENGTRSGIVDPGTLQVARFDGATFVSEGNGGTTGSAAAGSVVSAAAVSGFGVFSFGSTTPINPLPVELTAFWAETEGDGAARIRWNTATEKDNAGFEIERSITGESWQKVGFVPGQGTTAHPQAYSWLDVAGLGGKVYYRLRQLDTNGKATYSMVAAVKLQLAQQALALYPNPAKDQVTLRLPGAGAGPVQVQLTDLTGRVVLRTTVLFKGTEAVLPLTGQVKPGVYLLQVNGTGQKATMQRLVVQ
ncbi:T9SS type A sorting domain-containing protein [Hymenobacter busanensis]|uniref:T9SS type A sorting domain-containing protein n=1 Tax=Hymenobacter busanensis TaxID=2607656 RepID=A0A7L4ZWK8_9BACT|nr:T9SS type A sorting domain-containing protein [Hymenobacter busanensis]KAA9332246.1 T9SS type A sorting domain-containing protein [Hymenobacter busanensis]QHJ07417.1 T9SS type A sorting domain-containing protein [Hymenobacter busanensis]